MDKVLETLIVDEIGDSHLMTSIDTPLREDAFEKSDEEKIHCIARYFKGIMEELGLDLTDDSIQGTPYRVAKMYVKEIFHGLDPKNKPKISIFDNKYEYHKMLVEKDISVVSFCEHHFMPIVGKAHVAYVPKDHVIGLSKINRIVTYYCRRPQVQERMTLQIYRELTAVLGTDAVMVVVEAEHMCVSARGVQDVQSKTITMEYGGMFLEKERRDEFLTLIG